MSIVFASSLRLLVTFAIVLEVRGIFFFQIPWTTYGRSSSLNWNITTGLFLMSSPFINRDSASPTSLHWLSGRNMLNLVRHTNLCIHNSENYMFLWVVLFSCILTLVYQLIVKSMCAIVLIDAYYSCGLSSHSKSGMTRRNKLQYLFHI